MKEILVGFCRSRFSDIDSRLRQLGVVAVVSIIIAGFTEAFIINNIGSVFGEKDQSQSDVAVAGYILLFIFMLNGIVRVGQVYLTQLFVYKLGGHLTSTENSLFFSAGYDSIKDVHSAKFLKRFELINLIIHNVLSPIMMFLSNVVILFGMVVALAFLDFELLAYSSLAVVLFYSLVIRGISPRLHNNSSALSYKNELKIFNLRESFQGVKELLISGHMAGYVADFEDNEASLRKLQAMNLVYGATPRYVLEILVVGGLVTFLALSGFGMQAGAEFLGTLIPFGYAAMKLLPLAQSLYSNWASISAHITILEEVMHPLVSKPLPEDVANPSGLDVIIGQPSKLNIKLLTTGYQNNLILNSGALEFSCGVPYLLRGPSGSGKTTFVESLMGLKKSKFAASVSLAGGVVNNDTADWTKLFSYSSQQGIILNRTIRENLLMFRSGYISDQNILELLHRLNLGDLVSDIAGLDDILKENGMNLSGGQRQRLSIARTILSDRPVAIFDEVVSNLDSINADIVEAMICDLAQTKICFYITHKETFRYPSRVLYFKKMVTEDSINPVMEL